MSRGMASDLQAHEVVLGPLDTAAITSASAKIGNPDREFAYGTAGFRAKFVLPRDEQRTPGCGDSRHYRAMLDIAVVDLPPSHSTHRLVERMDSRLCFFASVCLQSCGPSCDMAVRPLLASSCTGEGPSSWLSCRNS